MELDGQVILITGTRKGIGRYLAEYYLNNGCYVYGCSRSDSDLHHDNYKHFALDVSDEEKVKKLISEIRKNHKRLDVLINNAGIASMNHVLLTPVDSVKKIFETNFLGMFLFCRESAKLMKKANSGRIINFVTVASPLKLKGEAIYAASKAAVINFTEIAAKELAEFGITVNAVGPTPIKTDLIGSVPEEKIKSLIRQQPIQRYGEFQDVVNVIDFFIRSESNFITSQIIYLGGIN